MARMTGSINNNLVNSSGRFMADIHAAMPPREWPTSTTGRSPASCRTRPASRGEVSEGIRVAPDVAGELEAARANALRARVWHAVGAPLSFKETMTGGSHRYEAMRSDRRWLLTWIALYVGAMVTRPSETASKRRRA